MAPKQSGRARMLAGGASAAAGGPGDSRNNESAGLELFQHQNVIMSMAPHLTKEDGTLLASSCKSLWTLRAEQWKTAAPNAYAWMQDDKEAWDTIKVLRRIHSMYPHRLFAGSNWATMAEHVFLFLLDCKEQGIVEFQAGAEHCLYGFYVLRVPEPVRFFHLGVAFVRKMPVNFSQKSSTWRLYEFLRSEISLRPRQGIQHPDIPKHEMLRYSTWTYEKHNVCRFSRVYQSFRFGRGASSAGGSASSAGGAAAGGHA